MFIEAARSREQQHKISDSIALNNLSPLEISIDFFFLFYLFYLFFERERERNAIKFIFIFIYFIVLSKSAKWLKDVSGLDDGSLEYRFGFLWSQKFVLDMGKHENKM